MEPKGVREQEQKMEMNNRQPVANNMQPQCNELI
jgi:hypothetical protein